jgi:glutathione synthase
VDVDLGDFDVVWMRKDPPFDMSYIFATYLLEMVPRHTLVVNDPVGLKRFNEKLWAMQFPELHPPTLLSRCPRRLRAFVEGQPKGAVLKPWDGNGGRGVVVTHAGDRNLNSLIELVSDQGQTSVIAQAYLEAIAQGDKRILLLEGEPVAAILRVPPPGDHRGNIHVGARVEACELDARDREICATLGPHLKRHGMVFVGIDVIGGYLTEINVTSPTGFREVHRLTGRRLEAELVDGVLSLHARHTEAP